jgi:predicted transposase YdaD
MLARAFEGAARKQWEEAMLKDYEIESPALRKILRASEAKGRLEGRDEGRVEGRLEGRVEGETRGQADAVLAVLAARGIEVPAELAERVRQCDDLELLGRLVRRSAVIASADQLFADG